MHIAVSAMAKRLDPLCLQLLRVLCVGLLESWSCDALVDVNDLVFAGLLHSSAVTVWMHPLADELTRKPFVLEGIVTLSSVLGS